MAKMRLRSSVLCGALFVLSCLLPLTESRASLITYNFEGNVTGLSGPAFLAPSPLSIGQLITGSFAYETNTPDDTSADPVFGSYIGPITHFQFALGPFSGVGIPTSAILITNGTSDAFQLSTSVLGAAVNGISPGTFSIALSDQNGMALESKVLGTIPALSAFPTQSIFRMGFQDSMGTISIVDGSLTGLTPVPLPAAAVLFATGLAALWGCVRQPTKTR